MQSYSHNHDSTNQMDSQLALSRPSVSHGGFEADGTWLVFFFLLICKRSECLMHEAQSIHRATLPGLHNSTRNSCNTDDIASSGGSCLAPLVSRNDVLPADSGQFAPQSPVFKSTAPWSAVNYSDDTALVFHIGLINEQFGYGTGQTNIAHFDFSCMVSPDSINMDLGNAALRAPVASNFPVLPMPFDMAYMDDVMNNSLTNFDVNGQAILSPFLPFIDSPFNSLPVPAISFPAVSSTRHNPCNFPGCYKIFKRASCHTRHENSVNISLPGLHLCPVPGCTKSLGEGYKRADKVTEHLWKKHANLGHTKA
ncbi:uncharacterized protein RCO7_14939 [Rhynchosporium graminicola]|uniref:C2H2-type domain-containing protein n=1 Tax=Rhynchosporium graminicola TaxID=2792576 RepID=A0A1E1LB97_9HELO|nr:uncharacterized protein RCO7_14939 [Rhynchosporium commune]